MKMSELIITEIRADEACQLRAAGSAAAIADYAAALGEGAIFPPVVVFRDTDGVHWLADGFHRLEAHKLAGRETINADVRDGDRRDAMLFAAGANAFHGLRRTHEDKRQAILALLHDPEWRQWSDREIARRTATDHKTVAKLRRELCGAGVNGDAPIERKFTTRHGTEATRRVAAGKPKADLTARVLAGLPDDAILAEVSRRGWLVTK
jgi:ParB-like chromosome segregation protein Spo0J